MRLPAIPFLTKTVNTEFFLALIFQSDKITSILFKEEDKSLNILDSKELEIYLESLSTEDIIVACDKIISKVEMSLPEGAELEKTIFATPFSWVDDGKIKPERLAQLKKISEELALTPMGFIVSIEAIIAYQHKKEGAPVNGIFIELSEKYLSAFIVRANNIIDVQMGSIEGTVEATVERLLGQVTKLDVLPSKIILLNNKEAEEISQRFLSHHWTKELPFMHLPQVTILDRGFENEAIINGVATQLNVSLVGGMVAAGVVAAGAAAASFHEDLVPESSDDFGFLQNEDVANVPEKVDEPTVKSENAEDFDFNDDKNEKAKVDNAEEVFEDESTIDQNEPEDTSMKGKVGGLLTPVGLSNFFKKFKNLKKFIIPFVALLVVVILLFLYYTFFVQAKVVVFTDQKAFSENAVDITLTTTGESSFEDKTLKIATIEEQVEGEESQETTGTKDTGKEATGTITIFNKTESPKQLAANTVIVSSNNLEFTLDEAVNIASTSSFSTSFSNAQGKIKASKFGKEYNLPSQTNFTIKGTSSSDVFARNDQAFSGGTKEELRVVSSKDLQTLENTLVKRLFDKAKSQAEASLTDSDALIPTYITYDFEDKNFDKKVNDQANNVKLAGAILYTLGSYNKEELTKFVASSDEFDVPKDFKLSDSDSSISISDIEQDGDDLSAKLSFNAVFKPQLEEDTIPSLISGKGMDEATKILNETPGISDASIQYARSIPLLPKILPLNKNNIVLEFKAQ